MALGLHPNYANSILSALGRNIDPPNLPITGLFLQLHVSASDPGAAGTANVAGNEVRKAVTFGAPSGGVMSNSAEIIWTTGEVDTAEDYTFLTLWDAVSAGNVVASGAMTANAVLVGDEFIIPVGDLDLSFPVMA